MRERELLYLSYADVVATDVGMTEILEALETAFREHGEGRAEMPPKPGIHPGGGDNFIHAMPAYIPALESAGVKWVSGFPDNQSLGLPYINGLLVLNDPATGVPLAVMDCVWITGARTGAATALSAKYLARPESSVVGVLGCGVQARTNLEGLQAAFPLERVMAYDIHVELAETYALEMATRFGIEAVAVATPEEAVKGCDIVVTAGPILKTPHATIQPGWLDEGAFASLVDFDSYWHADAIGEVDKFCTDDTLQLRFYQEQGYFQGIPPVHADLGELVTGRKPGREDPAERTMTANLGMALDDMAVAPLIYEKAMREGTGVRLPL
jgi:ornithine cyclodeaminase/alanine dehydrogenase-like protein (mu-crystallin family)